VRAVLDVNVIVSAVLSRTGTPAQLLRAWQQGAFELVASGRLLAELERTLAYPKLRARIPPDEAKSLIEWLRNAATIAVDPRSPPPIRSPNPGDDYLIALAASASAMLVSGESDLLDLATDVPIASPAQFLDLIGVK
jgi:putative PIN family toxin of toxin-antitoxin system